MPTEASAPIRLPAGFWERAQVTDALTERDIGALFRLLRQYAQVTQTQIERATGIPQPEVSRIMRGQRQVTTHELLTRIADGLHVPNHARIKLGLAPDTYDGPSGTVIPALDATPSTAVAPATDGGDPVDRRAVLGGTAGLGGLMLASNGFRRAHETSHETARWYPDDELIERVAHTRFNGNRVDLASVEWIGRALAAHRRAEDAIGGEELWPVVRSQLDAVTHLLPGSSGVVTDRLLTIAAEHAHWLSWVASQARFWGPAMRWLDLANGWAMDAGSADMISWIARVRAFYTLTAGDPARALRIAELGYRVPGLSPGAASIAMHTAAMAAASTRQIDRARHLADEAYNLAQRAPHAEERPPWLYWLGSARAKLNLGEVAHAVGDWSTAVDVFRDGLAELGDMPRDKAFYMSRLNDALQRL